MRLDYEACGAGIKLEDTEPGNTEVERLLMFRSAPDKDFYISPTCPWLRTGIGFDHLQNFWKAVEGCSRR